MVVEPLIPEIAGKTVLDLAAHDGRWSYHYASAGAKEVIGVEARQNLIDDFAGYPDDEAKARVTLHCADLFEFLEQAVREGKTFDVVAVLGFLYHTMDHFRLFVLLRKVEAKLIIVDSEFVLKNAPMIQIVKESPSLNINTTAHIEGQEMTIKGVPSIGAMEKFASVLGYQLTWADWSSLEVENRGPINDYFRKERKQRRTCYLRLP